MKKVLTILNVLKLVLSAAGIIAVELDGRKDLILGIALMAFVYMFLDSCEKIIQIGKNS